MSLYTAPFIGASRDFGLYGLPLSPDCEMRNVSTRKKYVPTGKKGGWANKGDTTLQEDATRFIKYLIAHGCATDPDMTSLFSESRRRNILMVASDMAPIYEEVRHRLGVKGRPGKRLHVHYAINWDLVLDKDTFLRRFE